ncbi:unnamed protein product [Aureobasidium pullulans]|nr:unnamed protein product [Aureobasidium pullulans]
MIEARHIQDHTANSTVKKYWAYPDRILPCTKDAGTCAYLDSVYHSHEISMLYTFILWAVLGGVLMFMLSLRYGKSVSRSSDIKTPLRRGLDSIGSLGRRWMLSESPGRGVLGRVTLLQVTVLSALLGYLLIFSLVGVTYKTWITPTKNHPELKTIRTGFGGWGDRVGALAYALTPLTIALCSRESVLSLITGIPYQHFNFLHRWTGRVIFIQSFLHTLVWTLVEGRFYQPQPETYTTFIKQKYIVWGIVAQIMITFLYIFSTSWAIRLTGYEFFKKTHALIGILYLGACWGHWDKLACWMIASLIIVLGDFGVRFLRTGLLHFGYRKGKPGLGFHSAIATVQHYGDDEDSVRSGITAKLAQIARATGGDSCTTSVILTGPYGGSSTEESADSNLLAVAGGTGVTSVLPTLQDTFTVAQTGTRAVDLVWIVRKIQDLSWIAPELTELKSWMSSGKADGLRLRIFVTREHTPAESSTSSTSSISEKGKGCCSKRAKGEKNGIVVTSSNDLTALQNNFSITYLGGSHPSIKDIVSDFSERTAICGGRSQVIGAGPMEIGTALRSAVAKENHAGKVWQGDESGIMALEWDCRS